MSFAWFAEILRVKVPGIAFASFGGALAGTDCLRDEEELVEQRRERRVQVHYPISFEGIQGLGKGKLFNLSLGGCAIESGINVQVGTTVTLRVYVPTHKEPIQVSRAGVTWAAGQDFGVEFVDLEPRERDRLHKLISDLQQGNTSIH